MNEYSAMIIEDDNNLLFIFDQALQAAGFETEVIRDGQKALDRLAVTRPDMVVTDLHLPRVTGVDIVRHIRADARLADIYIILVTADPQMADIIQDKADLTLIKPVTFSQLRDLTLRIRSSLGDN